MPLRSQVSPTSQPDCIYDLKHTVSKKVDKGNAMLKLCMRNCSCRVTNPHRRDEMK